jgi:hypothetical protein
MAAAHLKLQLILCNDLLLLAYLLLILLIFNLQVLEFMFLLVVLHFKLSLVSAQGAQLLLQKLELALEVVNFVHASELQVLAELGEVFNGLLIFFTLSPQLCLLSLDLFLEKPNLILLFSVGGLPHCLSGRIKGLTCGSRTVTFGLSMLVEFAWVLCSIARWRIRLLG